MTHFDIVMTQMFSMAAQHYTPEAIESPEWYNSHSWTEEQRGKFEEWMIEFLMTNKAARKEFMHIPLKNRMVVGFIVENFITNYGWKIDYGRREATRRR